MLDLPAAQHLVFIGRALENVHAEQNRQCAGSSTPVLMPENVETYGPCVVDVTFNWQQLQNSGSVHGGTSVTVGRSYLQPFAVQVPEAFPLQECLKGPNLRAPEWS